MARGKGRRGLFTILIVIGIAVLIIAAVVVGKTLLTPSTTDVIDTTSKDTPSVTKEAEETEKKSAESSTETTTAQPAIDSEKVSTVDISPMTISVSYMKGVGGFDYEVLRSPSGTQYVQFSASSLVGTKCTNDTGVFASIIESPTADETATITKTTVTDGTTYGLSLAEATCTSDADLLKQFQDSFLEPFSLLKKM